MIQKEREKQIFWFAENPVGTEKLKEIHLKMYLEAEQTPGF